MIDLLFVCIEKDPNLLDGFQICFHQYKAMLYSSAIGNIFTGPYLSRLS